MTRFQPLRLKRVFAGFIAILATLSLASAEPATVYPVLETDPVPSADDAADDPAIWVNESDPGASLVIGTDKESGLAVYDLKGKQLSFTPDGEMNNVDIRENFSLGGKPVVIVAASNRTDNTIAVYALNTKNGTLTSVAARPLASSIDVYGFCLYQTGDETYAFINSKTGEVQQWRLFGNGDGKVDAEKVTAFQVGTQVEGMVADDTRNQLYVGEERVAIWRYPLPIASDPEEVTRFPVDVREPLGNIIEDVEGLAIYKQPGEAGYLIASNQGNDEFLVYERSGDNKFLGSFRVKARDGVDEVTGSDGLEVTSAALPAPFDEGLVVIQDDENDDGAQNFKYVAWKDVKAALGLK
jgi:3-phytase